MYVIAVLFRNFTSQDIKNKEGSLALYLTVVTRGQEHLLVCKGYHHVSVLHKTFKQEFREW